MSLARLRQPERAPSAELVGRASLAGHVLRLWKRGRDGSGKCTIIETGSPGDIVHGVLFRLPRLEKAGLDRSEGLGEHYHERSLEVRVEQAIWSAWTYQAAPDRIDRALRPFDWYKGLVVEGARTHDLPAEYVRRLEALAADADPDPERARRGRRGVPPERLG